MFLKLNFNSISPRLVPCPSELLDKRKQFTRQITIADDECHPPLALVAKMIEVDKLIQAEQIETGQVLPLSVDHLHLLHPFHFTFGCRFDLEILSVRGISRTISSLSSIFPFSFEKNCPEKPQRYSNARVIFYSLSFCFSIDL